MAKYQLTDKQKDILRAAANGLRDKTVAHRWNILTHGGEWMGDGIEGFPGAKEMGLTLTDLRDFEDYGFLRLLNQNGGFYVYEVREQTILDAVDGDFEDSNSDSSVTPQTVIIEQGAGSILNVSVNSQHVKQSINASQSLPNDAKLQLEREAEILYEILEETQTSQPQESRVLEKHLRRLVEDVSEPGPDKQDVTDLLARLRKAGQALAFIAQIAVSINTIGEIIMQLPFML